MCLLGVGVQRRPRPACDDDKFAFNAESLYADSECPDQTAHLRTANALIRLRICAVWSVPLLSAYRIVENWWMYRYKEVLIRLCRLTGWPGCSLYPYALKTRVLMALLNYLCNYIYFCVLAFISCRFYQNVSFSVQIQQTTNWRCLSYFS